MLKQPVKERIRRYRSDYNDTNIGRSYDIENRNEALSIQVGDLQKHLVAVKEFLVHSNLPYSQVVNQITIIDAVLERDTSSYQV